MIEMLESYNMEAANEMMNHLAPLDIDQVNHAQLKAPAWTSSFEQSS